MMTKFVLVIAILSVINGDLVVASRRFDHNNLVLNPVKCKFIILSKSYTSDLSFSINDVQVPIADHWDLSGVTIVNSLNFSKQIAKITKQVRKQIDVLSRLKNMLSIS